MDDPDIPESVKSTYGIESFDHWVLYNIPSDTRVISGGEEMLGLAGLNSRGEVGYIGPCPPDREHRYFFRVYALTDMLTFTKTPTLRDVENAVHGILLESATLMGTYKRLCTEVK